MRRGLAKSRGAEGFFGRLKALFSGAREIDENIAADIEEVLLTSDVGVATTETILARIKSGLAHGDLDDDAKVWGALRGEARRILEGAGRSGGIAVQKKPAVVLLVGVNGAGKTTTIGKLAAKLKGEGNRVLLAAGDTFRAAAVQQLKVWGERVGCEVVAGKDGADPSSVIFDAIRRGEEIGADVILADTAGRLHTKTNLMAEMSKIARSAGKALAGAPHETLLVIDATNGQNALAQAKEFTDALDVTGIVLTKLDGTAKGGVVLGICDTLRVPVRYVGLGERADDLHEFSPDAFVEALLGRDGEGAAA
jgi:fused signal recognition particle receptor